MPNGDNCSIETDAFRRLQSKTISASTSFANTYEYSKSKTSNAYTTPLVSKETLKVGSSSVAYQYTYDSNNNILTIKNKAGSLIVSYEYDGLNRLIRENIVGGNTTVFKYDKGGNIQFKKVYSYSAAAGSTVFFTVEWHIR